MSISYADYEFYTTEYHGASFDSAESAMPYLNKASDAVRRAIRYKDEINVPTAYQEEHLKRAVCLTADFFYESGNTSGASADGVSGYSIGDVNMQLGGNSADSNSMATYGVPMRVYEELIVTGYLYRGI
ncbi:MAG: hypothetical protein J6Z43_03970 [Clostridiales bacterium]|nr:hypothetical protein [Clostridiales bacterium]